MSDSATLRTIAHQAPLSMGFSRKECWSGLPCPPPGDLPDSGIEPASHVSCISRWILYHWCHLGSSKYTTDTKKECIDVYSQFSKISYIALKSESQFSKFSYIALKSKSQFSKFSHITLKPKLNYNLQILL